MIWLILDLNSVWSHHAQLGNKLAPVDLQENLLSIDYHYSSINQFLFRFDLPVSNNDVSQHRVNTLVHYSDLTVIRRHSIRRAALRAAARSYSPPVLRSSIPASRHISSCLVRAPTPCSHYISRTPFRQYATDPEKDLHDEEHSSDNASDLAEGIKEKTSSAAESVSNTVGDAIDSVTPDGPASSAQSTPIRSASSSTSSFATDPSKTLYIGNLYFEVTPEALRTEFGRHGEVEDTKVVYDGRGLSKG